jgi:hypothetical protein
MGLREFISKSRPSFRAAFFWFVGSKRGVGVEKPLDIVPFALVGKLTYLRDRFVSVARG